MPFSNASLRFDNVDVTAVRAAYYGACKELGIAAKSDADRNRRESLAALIFEIAKLGERGAVDLQRRAVRRCKVQVQL
jgi:hypothetical protein